MNETELTREEPPPPRRPPIDWAPIMLRISEEAPDEWVVAARHVTASSVTHLKRSFLVDARSKGADVAGNRVSTIYVRWISGVSRLTPRAEKIRDARDKAQAAREKIAALRKEAKS